MPYLFCRRFLPLLLALLVVLGACAPDEGGLGGGSGEGQRGLATEGGGTGGTGEGGDEAASLTVTLEGRYAPLLESLDLTIGTLELRRLGQGEDGGSEWVTLPIEPQTLNILSFTDGMGALLGEAEVTPGTYDAVRVGIDAASLTVAGQTYEMDVQDGGISTATVEPPVEAEDGGLAAVALEFDPVQAVDVAGANMFKLHPAVESICEFTQGSLSGVVEPSGSGAAVIAYNPQTGHLVASARVRDDGTYTLYRLHAADSAGAPIAYRIEAVAPGYFPGTPYLGVTVVPGKTTGGYDFELEDDENGSDDDDVVDPWW